MNLKRVIIGPILSFIFLFFFAYIISGVQYLFKGLPQAELPKVNPGIFSASVSGAVQNIAQPGPSENITQPSSEPEINAESAISVESNLSDLRKIIFTKNIDALLPIASLTKLMTAVVVLDNYDLSENIIVGSVADSQDPVKQDVKLGDTMPVESFLEIMLVDSSNKSAHALSELAGEEKFVGLMNAKAEEIGLKNTFFADPTGLSPEDVSTASDLAKLAEYILKNYPRIGDISKSKDFYVPGFGRISNTDQLLEEVPETVCSKTGFTDQAKGCLLLVTDNPKGPKGYPDYLINVILGADDRFSEMRKLINWSSAACN